MYVYIVYVHVHVWSELSKMCCLALKTYMYVHVHVIYMYVYMSCASVSVVLQPMWGSWQLQSIMMTVPSLPSKKMSITNWVYVPLYACMSLAIMDNNSHCVLSLNISFSVHVHVHVHCTCIQVHNIHVHVYEYIGVAVRRKLKHLRLPLMSSEKRGWVSRRNLTTRSATRGSYMLGGGSWLCLEVQQSKGVRRCPPQVFCFLWGYNDVE